MSRPVVARVALLILAVYSFALISPLFAADSEEKPKSGAIKIHLDRTEGKSIEGELLNTSLQLKADFGKVELDLSQIEKVMFRSFESPESRDTIEFHDESHLRGLLQVETIQVKTESGVETVDIKQIREFHIIHDKKPFNLFNALLGLITLTAMEIVLGIDNIIFLAIITTKLPKEDQPRARKLGLGVALGSRLILLASLTFLLQMTRPLFTVPDLPMFHDLEAREISFRDLILLVGGLFLIWKSTKEMHEKLEAAEHEKKAVTGTATFGKVLVQIAIIDIVFSLDSVITAVGMVDDLWVMVVAMIIAMVFMLAFAGAISDFVNRHPTLKVLALSFLILIGVMLVIEGFGQHMNKGYIYFAMAFAVGIEFLNMKIRKADPVKLHNNEKKTS